MATGLASDLRELLAKGGFRLTKWVSNSSKVVASLPESERAASVKDLCFDKPSIERALGVLWDIDRDEFGFRIKVKDNPPTSRIRMSIRVTCEDYYAGSLSEESRLGRPYPI
jgi:hypothetical protein